MSRSMNQYSKITENSLQNIHGGSVNPTCGALVAMSIYASLALVSGPVGVGVAMATGGVAAGSFCR